METTGTLIHSDVIAGIAGIYQRELIAAMEPLEAALTQGKALAQKAEALDLSSKAYKAAATEVRDGGADEAVFGAAAEAMLRDVRASALRGHLQGTGLTTLALVGVPNTNDMAQSIPGLRERLYRGAVARYEMALTSSKGALEKGLLGTNDPAAGAHYERQLGEVRALQKRHGGMAGHLTFLPGGLLSPDAESRWNALVAGVAELERRLQELDVMQPARVQFGRMTAHEIADAMGPELLLEVVKTTTGDLRRNIVHLAY